MLTVLYCTSLCNLTTHGLKRRAFPRSVIIFVLSSEKFGNGNPVSENSYMLGARKCAVLADVFAVGFTVVLSVLLVVVVTVVLAAELLTVLASFQERLLRFVA